MPFFPARRSDVPPFLAMDVLAAANRLKAEGKPVVSLAVGQPGDPAPLAVREAAAAALARIEALGRRAAGADVRAGEAHAG